jgi:hypothetical protein
MKGGVSQIALICTKRDFFPDSLLWVDSLLTLINYLKCQRWTLLYYKFKKSILYSYRFHYLPIDLRTTVKVSIQRQSTDESTFVIHPI